jgi:hypothetical protein
MNMTRFNINRIQRSPEEWSAIAFKQTTENNIQWNIAGGLIVAAIAASATTPVTGLLIAGWAIFDSISKAREIQRNQAAIREDGAIAHVLEGDDFRKYLRQVGDEVVQEELSFATEQNLSFSNAALDYFDTQGITPQTTNTTTRSIAASPPLSAIATQSSVHVLDQSIDIVKEIASPVRNCIIFGIGGSGKGMLVSCGLRQIKAVNPNKKVFYVDPKNEPGEYGYTEGVADVVHRKTCDGLPPQEICDWIDEVINEYTEWAVQQEESLLVIDEGSTLGDAAKKCNNTRIGTLILHTASLGGAKRKHVWLIAQSPFTDPLGLKLATTSQLTAVAIIDKTNTNALKQWKRSPILEMIDLDRLNELIKASPVGRAVFFGGNSRWGAMPELTNYSDIDRDNNKPTGDALTTEDRRQLRAVTATQLKPTEVAMIERLERTRHLTLEDFIVKEIGEGDRLPELLKAIAQTIKKANHSGLLYKFKLD